MTKELNSLRNKILEGRRMINGLVFAVKEATEDLKKYDYSDKADHAGMAYLEMDLATLNLRLHMAKQTYANMLEHYAQLHVQEFPNDTMMHRLDQAAGYPYPAHDAVTHDGGAEQKKESVPHYYSEADARENALRGRTTRPTAEERKKHEAHLAEQAREIGG